VPVRVVTFDFWQTLLADTPAGSAAAHALRLAGVGQALRGAGFWYDPAALEAADIRALERLDAIWRAHRDVAPAEQVSIFLDALDPALAPALAPEHRAAAERAYATAVLTHRPVVSPGAVEAIRALAAAGYTLAIVSNTGRTPGTVLRELLAGIGVLAAFRVLSFSDEVGRRKPDAEIFRRTLAEAGCAPGEAVHVGDDPVNDVGGARAVGMRALHYVPDGRPGAEAADAVVRHLGDLPALLGPPRETPPGVAFRRRGGLT
jgi:putative hydrolase of the HAD superfamily